MKNPVVESIAKNIQASINLITVANGFSQTLTAIRPRRIDYKITPPADRLVLIEQVERTKSENPETQTEIIYQDFLISAFVVDSDTAAAVAQVDRFTVGGTIEATDLFIFSVTDDLGTTSTLSVAAGSTDAETVAATLAAAWNAQAGSAFTAITASSSGADVVLTADVPGDNFTVSVSTTEQGGGAADGQTFAVSSTAGTANQTGIIDTRINQIAADIETKLKADHTRGGYAQDTMIGEATAFHDPKGQYSGLVMIVKVEYRTAYLDPRTKI